MTDGGVGVSGTRLGDIHASGHVGCHDVTSGLVENGFWHAGVSRAERFPVPEDGVSGGHVAVPDETGFQGHLRLMGIEFVLLDDLSSEVWDVVALGRLAVHGVW